jgi:5-methyltetrahydropteroyltriglutamate--homocysteine methyltransferase
MFDVTQVGSWPRSRELLRALRDRRKGAITEERFLAVAEGEVRKLAAIQEACGVDVVVDGELRRDNFYSFVTEKLDGTRLMTLAEMLDTVEDKSGFEEILSALDVPASAISNPTCVGRLRRRRPLAVDEYAFLRQLTDKPIKITLPGPYLLTRAMWVTAYSGAAYADKIEMGRDVVAILRAELLELAAAGCDFVQFDEPVLTELVMSENVDRRTFM